MRIEEEIKQEKFLDEYHKLLINLVFTQSWINVKQIQFYRQYDISPQQYNLLRILRGQNSKPVCINLLIDRMLDKTSNASRLVDKLALKELVIKTISQLDKRQVDVIISEKGLQLLKVIDIEETEYANDFKNLTIEEAVQLNALLDKIRSS